MLGAEAAANTVVGLKKGIEGAASVIVGTLGTETGIGAGAAILGGYELYQGSGQLETALLQGGAAISWQYHWRGRQD